jgi:hypothetical protein
MTLENILQERYTLAEKLRRYLPQCGKQDMTNHGQDLYR